MIIREHEGNVENTSECYTRKTIKHTFSKTRLVTKARSALQLPNYTRHLMYTLKLLLPIDNLLYK